MSPKATYDLGHEYIDWGWLWELARCPQLLERVRMWEERRGMNLGHEHGEWGWMWGQRGVHQLPERACVRHECRTAGIAAGLCPGGRHLL